MVPATAPRPGQPVTLAWRLHWSGDKAAGPPGGRVVQTRVGFGYQKDTPPPGRMQFHIDFSGGRLSALARGSVLQAVANGNANVRVLAARAEPMGESGDWRVTLDVQRLDTRQPLELRAFLRLGQEALTETWTYAAAPE